MAEHEVQTSAAEELVNITSLVQAEVNKSGLKNGSCLVYVPHTTAGVTINEGADPAVRSDLLMGLRKIISDSWAYTHAEGNSPAHLKTSLVGSTLNVPVIDGKLRLGTWQQIFFCEFDGPRRRRFGVIC